MIVGTAGHIDHGKTTLVRALTGVDTDRLPEEKARGISIELGYAYLDVPGNGADRIGFIDVPGHERLVHTMLAGATGIDFALLLVAADDGVMPQTREHLAVLSLLGIARGVVAITKVDRVDGARREQVRDEVVALLVESDLSGSPVVFVSAQSGEGVDELRALLFHEARQMTDETERRADAGANAMFRLAIDRAFTLSGVGSVATGTIHAGRINVGDEVTLTPSAGPRTARVRSLHAQNRSVSEARAGQRCAIGLVGIAKDEISRGQWLVGEGDGRGTDRIDVRLTLWHGEARPLRSGTPVHVHIGSEDVIGTVAILQSQGGGAVAARLPVVAKAVSATDGATDTLAPGDTGLVQLVLRRAISAWHGVRVVLRDNSASRTLAGGVVLDPGAPARYRRTPQRISELGAWQLPTPAQRLRALVDVAPFGVHVDRWRAAEGFISGGDGLFAGLAGDDVIGVSDIGDISGARLDAQERSGLADVHAAQLSRAGERYLHAQDKTHGNMLLSRRQVQVLTDAALLALAAFHAKEPDVLGPDAARLRRLTMPRLPESLWRAWLAAMQASGRVAVRGAYVHLPEHGVRLSAVDERLAQMIAPMLEAAAFEGAWARDLARDARESEPLMRTTLARLAQAGTLHQVVKDLYFSASAMERLARLARHIAASNVDGDVTAAAFRDAAGLGRKRAIQLLEYFDRIGLLRRVGDVHRLRSDTTLFGVEGPA